MCCDCLLRKVERGWSRDFLSLCRSQKKKETGIPLPPPHPSPPSQKKKTAPQTLLSLHPPPRPTPCDQCSSSSGRRWRCSRGDPKEGTDFDQSRFGQADLTNFGQANFSQNQFGPIQFWPIHFGNWCVSPKVEPEGWGSQNFALFFPSPTHQFRSFCLSLCFSWFLGGFL